MMNVVVDDITNPDLSIYKDATLIYSIRPPEELQNHIKRVAESVGADLIIKPLSTEFINPDNSFEAYQLQKGNIL